MQRRPNNMTRPLNKVIVLPVVLAGLMIASSAQAQLFQVDLTVNGVTETRSFSSLDSALTLLQGAGIRSVFPGYTSGTPLTANVNVAGLNVPIIVPAGTTTAILTVPGTNSSVAFAGQTAAATQNQLHDFFSGAANTGDPVSALPPEVRATLPVEVQNALKATYTDILQAAVQQTLYDPIAGNPSALMPQMVTADFTAGVSPPGQLLGVNQPRAAGWYFSAGFNLNTTTGGGFDTDIYTAPLHASYYVPSTATEFFIDAPIAYGETSGTGYVQASSGFGVRQRVWHGTNFEWNVTPAVRTGIAGSESIGRGSLAVGGSLTSDLRLALPGDYTLSIGNTAAYYQTEPYKFGDYDIRYHLQNQFYRNGVVVSHPLGEVLGHPLQGGLSFIDTRVTGDETYIPAWQEYGIVLATGGRYASRFTISYIDGDKDYQAVRFGFNTTF